MKRVLVILLIGILALLLIKPLLREKDTTPAHPGNGKGPFLDHSETNHFSMSGNFSSRMMLYTNNPQEGVWKSGGKSGLRYDLPKGEGKTTYDYIAPYLNAETLSRYEGSYAMDDLWGEGSKKGLSVNLQSRWVLGGSNTPQAGLRFRWDPLTRQYTVIGGELFLPKTGIGVSRELDEESGEARTFFKLKKEF